MTHQTIVIREALSKGVNTIEGIIRYGLEKRGVVVREHSIHHVLRQDAVKEELDKLRTQNALLKKRLTTAEAKLKEKLT